jgi:hypothetical protein
MNKKELLKTAKPILFNTEMTRAILDGRKVQTRRLVALENNNLTFSNMQGFDNVCALFDNKDSNEAYVFECVKPKYKKGDVLYVRETWTYGEVVGDYDEISGKDEFWLEQTSSQEDNENIFYRADVEDAKKEGIDFSEAFWKPSIHMPKKYARTFLKVTRVRVERLQDISIFDAIKERVSEINVSERLHQMEDNPFVFVYEFEVLK